MNEQFIDRVIGVLVEMRLDELSQKTKESAAKKARTRQKRYRDAATAVAQTGDPTSDNIQGRLRMLGYHAGDQAERFEARARGEKPPPQTPGQVATRKHLRKYTDRYQGTARPQEP